MILSVTLTRVSCRLGQRQLAEPVDWGVAPPPASSHARVAQMLRLAVGSGVGGIHLLSPMQVGPSATTGNLTPRGHQMQMQNRSIQAMCC